MINGFAFDIWMACYAVGIACAFFAGILFAKAPKSRKKPFDWAKECPELLEGFHSHVKIVP